jgi:hypothetical protein
MRMANEIQNGVKEANKTTGRNDKIDDLVFNSCFMGSAEVAMQMRNSADYILASENFVNGNAFEKWDNILKDVQKELESGKSFEPRKFASDMVEFFRKEEHDLKEEYPELTTFKESYLTLTAIESKKMDAVAENFAKLLDSVKQSNANKILFDSIKGAKNYKPTQNVPGGSGELYAQLKDFGSIMDNIVNSKDASESLKNAARQTKQAFEDAKVNEEHEGKGMEGSQGLTLWGPENYSDYIDNGASYKEYVNDFAEKSGWHKYLNDISAKIPKSTIAGHYRLTQSISMLESRLNITSLDDAAKQRIRKELDKQKLEFIENKKQSYFGNY